MGAGSALITAIKFLATQGFKQGFGFVARLIGLVLKTWQISIPVILVMVLFSNAAVDSIQQRSWAPIIIDGGARLVASDAVLQSKWDNPNLLLPVKQSSGKYALAYYLWDVAKFLSDIGMYLFFMFWFPYYLYKNIFLPWNTSGVFAAIFLTLTFAFILMIAANYALYVYDLDYLPDKETRTADLGVRSLPGRGVVLTLMNVPRLFKPVLSEAPIPSSPLGGGYNVTDAPTA